MKATTSQIMKISSISSLCIKVSQETSHDAFFEYSGHMDVINVRVCKGGIDYERTDNQILMRHYLNNPELNEQDFYNTKSLEEIEKTLKRYLL